jgi:hypothetical protein
LASDATGRTLVATVGFERPIHVARLDPRTGAQLAARPLAASDSVPVPGGVVAGGAWIVNTAGGRTSAMRLSLATLAPTATSVPATTLGRITVRVLGGKLWVTEPLAGASLNYCANPVSGKPLVKLPPLPGESVLLTADASTLFYTVVPVNAHSVELERAPVSSGCGS